MTPAQRRNQMACRKLAQQRVLRIMQLQSTAPCDKGRIGSNRSNQDVIRRTREFPSRSEGYGPAKMAAHERLSRNLA